MAKYVKGNIWTALDGSGFICVTTNSVLDRNGCLVMGAGSALQAKQLFPDLPKKFGTKLSALRQTTHCNDYWLMIEDVGNPRIQIGALQTKRHWMKPSPLDLVEASIDYLRVTAIRSLQITGDAYNCVMPGIGLGGLSFNEVKCFTDQCPDNVVFWYK